MKSYFNLSFIPNMILRLWQYYGSLSIFQQCTLFVFAGLILGMSVVVARISNATSYLSDSPETCMNCHVMTDAYATWRRSSHSHVATCNDCHVPHDNTIAKYAFKAQDGMKHSYVFTLRSEEQVLKLSDGAKPVIQNNCIRCHDQQLEMIKLVSQSDRACWNCHSNIHGSVQSLSASPEVLRPQLPDAGLDWMKKSQDK